VLSVPLHWDLSLIQKLISSPEFSDLHAGLVELGEKVQSLERELEASGIARPRKGKTSKISSSASVLTRVTREIARAQGYALVLRKEDTLYLDGSQLEDLSPQVKERLPELFGP